MAVQQEVDEWVAHAQRSKLDLSRDEDLSIALMNLISLEEHFYFTAMKTDNQKYLEMLASVRTLRTSLLKKIVTDPKGEEWCISKHLLAASMRLMEVGTKELAKSNKEEAHAFFTSAFELWSLFFAINLKMIGAQKLERMAETKKEGGMMPKFSAVIKKLVDCCREW